MPQLISYSEAKRRGLPTYYTGVPCPAGHMGERSVKVRQCLECCRIQSTARAQKDPQREQRAKRAYHWHKTHGRDSYLRRKRGITESQYWSLVAGQGGQCGICGVSLLDEFPVPFAVDHDHSTGKIRGLLCRKHNMGLGMFSDDPKLLRAAARWIEKHAKN